MGSDIFNALLSNFNGFPALPIFLGDLILTQVKNYYIIPVIAALIFMATQFFMMGRQAYGQAIKTGFAIGIIYAILNASIPMTDYVNNVLRTSLSDVTMSGYIPESVNTEANTYAAKDIHDSPKNEKDKTNRSGYNLANVLSLDEESMGRSSHRVWENVEHFAIIDLLSTFVSLSNSLANDLTHKLIYGTTNVGPGINEDLMGGYFPALMFNIGKKKDEKIDALAKEFSKSELVQFESYINFKDGLVGLKNSNLSGGEDSSTKKQSKAVSDFEKYAQTMLKYGYAYDSQADNDLGINSKGIILPTKIPSLFNDKGDVNIITEKIPTKIYEKEYFLRDIQKAAAINWFSADNSNKGMNNADQDINPARRGDMFDCITLSLFGFKGASAIQNGKPTNEGFCQKSEPMKEPTTFKSSENSGNSYSSMWKDQDVKIVDTLKASAVPMFSGNEIDKAVIQHSKDTLEIHYALAKEAFKSIENIFDKGFKENNDLSKAYENAKGFTNDLKKVPDMINFVNGVLQGSTLATTIQRINFSQTKDGKREGGESKTKSIVEYNFAKSLLEELQLNLARTEVARLGFEGAMNIYKYSNPDLYNSEVGLLNKNKPEKRIPISPAIDEFAEGIRISKEHWIRAGSSMDEKLKKPVTVTDIGALTKGIFSNNDTNTNTNTNTEKLKEIDVPIANEYYDYLLFMKKASTSAASIVNAADFLIGKEYGIFDMNNVYNAFVAKQDALTVAKNIKLQQEVVGNYGKQAAEMGSIVGMIQNFNRKYPDGAFGEKTYVKAIDWTDLGIFYAMFKTNYERSVNASFMMSKMASYTEQNMERLDTFTSVLSQKFKNNTIMNVGTGASFIAGTMTAAGGISNFMQGKGGATVNAVESAFKGAGTMLKVFSSVFMIVFGINILFPTFIWFIALLDYFVQISLFFALAPIVVVLSVFRTYMEASRKLIGILIYLMLYPTALVSMYFIVLFLDMMMPLMIYSFIPFFNDSSSFEVITKITFGAGESTPMAINLLTNLMTSMGMSGGNLVATFISMILGIILTMFLSTYLLIMLLKANRILSQLIGTPMGLYDFSEPANNKVRNMAGVGIAGGKGMLI